MCIDDALVKTLAHLFLFVMPNIVGVKKQPSEDQRRTVWLDLPKSRANNLNFQDRRHVLDATRLLTLVKYLSARGAMFTVGIFDEWSVN